jgi:hypothetical protein
MHKITTPQLLPNSESVLVPIHAMAGLTAMVPSRGINFYAFHILGAALVCAALVSDVGVVGNRP